MNYISKYFITRIGGNVKNILHLKKALIIFLAISSTVFASGNIKGVVTDSLSNETLVGANIMLLGTSLGAATSFEGDYLITAVPPGNYTIRCSYLGYEPKEIEVTVVDNRTLELDFTLSYALVEGEEIVVTGQALGQAAAINQQLSSNTIVNVVSEQKIKELPDANAAEALGRLPGVSVVRSGGEANKIMLRGLNQNLTTITVDGIKLSPTDADSRGVDLSTISQGSLSGIVLSKAITSDMEAEAIAGNVNFVTKTAPEIRELQVDAFGTYGSLDNTAEQYNFVGRYGERFFNNFMGVQVFGNIERKNRSNEQFNVSYDQSLLNKTDYQISDFKLKYAPEIRKRRGLKLLLDFKTPDDGVIKFNAEYNRTERRLSIIDRNYPVTAGDVVFNFTGQEINTDIKNIALHGENHLLDWQINWNFSYSESNSETPYDYNLHFNEPSISQNGVVIAGMHLVPENQRKSTAYEDLIPYALNNFDVAYFNRTETSISSNLDYEKTFFLDAKKNYNLLGLTGEVKFGAKYRSKYHRRNTSQRQAMYYNGNGFYDYVLNEDGTSSEKDWARYGFNDMDRTSGNLVLLTNFLDNSTRDIYDKYLLNPMLSADKIRNFYEMCINGYNPETGKDEYTLDHSVDGTNYRLTESVTSGYLMNTLNIGNTITLITGLRIEHDDNTYHSFYTNEAVTEFSKFRDTTSAHSESILLPNIHLILKPTDYMNVRLAAFRGLTRPNFNFRLPTYIYGNKNIYTGENPFVLMSNSNLKNADAWNFEVNLQFYSNTIGLFSVSGFYKEIKNEVHQLWYVPIKNKNTTDSLGVTFPSDVVPFTTTYSLTYPYNSEKPTRVWGFEVEHQTNLRFLPGLLSNFVLSYNFSFIKTETYTPAQKYTEYTVTIPGSPFPTKRTRVDLYEALTRIQDSPEFFGNISLGYDIAGFSARVSYFYQGEYYNGYSGDGYSNTIQKAFGRVDLSLKQKFTDNISVGLNVNNINNIDEGTYLENSKTGWKLETSSYQYGTTADLWLRVSM